MKLEKVDEIVGELVEGRSYLVPVVVGTLGGKRFSERLPVVGNRHYDVEFFDVHLPHYHLDLRFVDMEWWRSIGKIVVVGVGRDAKGLLPPPVYMTMQCLQNNVVVTVTGSDTRPRGFEDMRDHFKGMKCGGSAKAGWICPHKGTFLGSTPANYWGGRGGVITCPAHGLKIDAKTGRVL